MLLQNLVNFEHSKNTFLGKVLILSITSASAANAFGVRNFPLKDVFCI